MRSRSARSRRPVANPRPLSQDLVYAQQARRALDYLVGFNLSPLLWKKIRRGLSAGRVQSPALRLICEREDEIEKFKSEEYWTLLGKAEKNGQAFEPRLWQFQGTKIEQFSFRDEKSAKGAEAAILKSAGGKLKVTSVEKKQRRRNPAAPFTTSTLQQEASRKLGYGAQRTMRIAQQLYEGIDLTGEGQVGLISYMRTDSVNLSQDALAEIRDVTGGAPRRPPRRRSRASTRPNPRTPRKPTKRYAPLPRPAPPKRSRAS